MKGLDARHLVDVLEAIYALERSDEEWLTECLLALSRVTGDDHHHIGFFYDASDIENLKVWNWCRVRPAAPELSGVWNVFQASINPDFVRATFRSLFVGSGRKTALECIKPILAERERLGYGDFFYLNALDPTGFGCVLSFSANSPEFALEAKDTALLKRIATHLTAAYRCRRRLTARRGAVSATDAQRRSLTDATEVVLDARGRVLHAEAIGGREALSIEATSGAARARGGSSELERWHALTGARWTLVDSFEENGRRYVVARENHADAPDFSAFTDRERQVVVHAALGLSNKEIAYTLGISATTVRVLVARAAHRLGLRTRRELLAHSMLRDVRPSTAPETRNHDLGPISELSPMSERSPVSELSPASE